MACQGGKFFFGEGKAVGRGPGQGQRREPGGGRGDSRADGEIVFGFHPSEDGAAGHPADSVEERLDAGQGLVGSGFTIESQGIGLQTRIDRNSGAGGKAADVHGEGIVGRQAKGFVFQSPVFDEGDVGVGKSGGGCGHTVKDTRKMGNGEGWNGGWGQSDQAAKLLNNRITIKGNGI